MKRFKLSDNINEINYEFCGLCAKLISYHEDEDNAILKIKLPYDAVYGMGEKYNAINQKGKTVINCVEEKFCHQEEKTYCPSPFFLTDTGFGLYVDTDCKTTFEFKDDITVYIPLDAEIVLFDGTPQKIISDYMSLFGSAKLPPKWAFGPWISANHWDTQEKTEAQIENIKKFNYPVTVLVLEAWSDEATFYIFNGAKYTPVKGNEVLNYSDFNFETSQWPNPKSMVEKLHKNGVHIVLWQIPVYKKQGSDEILNSQNENDRDCAKENKLCVFTNENKPYEIPEGHWFAGSMIPDFTNPKTKELWFKKRKYLLDIGIDGFKTDGGEFVCSDGLSFNDNSTGKQMKNKYAQLYTQSYTEFLGENHVLFSRAGYSGQHITPILWAGDQQSENVELKSALKAGLSAAMTGIPFWGFDIAGFAGPMPTLDLYRHATQIACFCPIMQWHSEPDGGQFKELMPGANGNNERSPWNLAEIYNAPEFIDEMRYWHNLRMNLLPYIYSRAIESVKNNKPMISPLVYSFPDDKEVLNIEDEFMLGESILVAPIVEDNSNSRSLYLPQGTWFNFFTHESVEGGQKIKTEHKNQLPVFLRSGYGIALNLDDTLELGSNVGNKVDGYNNLYFVLAGKCGTFDFKDDLGNDFTIKWKDSKWEKTGISSSDFSVEIIK